MAISNNNCWLESSLQWNKEYKYRMIAIEAEAVMNVKCGVHVPVVVKRLIIQYLIF